MTRTCESTKKLIENEMMYYHRSGAISKEEIKRVCKEMGVGVEEAELDSIIARYSYSRDKKSETLSCLYNCSCDKNGSGQIDYHDFALSLSRQHPPGSDQPTITTTTRKDYKHPEAQRYSQTNSTVKRC